ncbi:DUF4214 domain-containing protein [uncultured Ramlibacter sp.]|uniref:DUF4214 domain-containing protein n=1 Tax=uncultured Ramlibacter sp. TaxID=260755 RepID=UPI00261CAB81|nr:DUF4214 domain-containing protein [uncultured Ramlibacter sp.]
MAAGAAVLVAACGGGAPTGHDPMAGDAAGLASFAPNAASISSLQVVSYPGKRSDYLVSVAMNGEVNVRASANGPTSSYKGLARIYFSDFALAFDVQSVAGQAYRLYKATFDRQPDTAGLGYQIAALEASGMSLQQVAQNFAGSPEYLQRYGNTDNNEFVSQLYLNALHRPSDAAGLAFHVDHLNAGTKSRAEVLVNFSESPENQAQVLPAIQEGIAYTPAQAAPADARNGSYLLYAADARQYTLDVNFDARTYRITGPGLDTGGTIASEGSEFVFQSAEAIAGVNNARFTYSNDTLVGGFRFASGVLPFVAARSFVDTVAEAVGTYNFLSTVIDTAAAPNSAIFTGEITAAGQTRTCDDNTIYKISLCPAASVASGTLSISGTEFRSSTSQGAFTFRVARMGNDRLFLRGSPSSTTARRMVVGTLESASFAAGTFTGVTNRGERVSTTINGPSYASAALSQAGGASSSRSGTASATGTTAPSSISPAGMVAIRTSAGDNMFAIRGSGIAVVVSSRGSSTLPGYMEFGRP